jgi:SM-20-related protein
MTIESIRLIDDFLAPEGHLSIWQFLNAPGWNFGAFSDMGPTGSRYFFKHFAGYVQNGQEARTASDIEGELSHFPVLASVWAKLKAGPLVGRALARCYANAMPAGAEGGLHRDSNVDTHFTAIYYPHMKWDPALAGETLFFNSDSTDVIATAYPKPNRLVIFPGTIPHVARPMSAKAISLRITLMFKTGPG